MNGRKVFLFVIALIEWYALIAQLVLHMKTVPVDTTEAVVRFFSYFTILTNILVSVSVTAQLLTPAHNQSAFFSRPSVQTAITLYITVVGLIYNLVLRQLWDSEGLQAVLHDLLHTVTPLLSIIYWWVWTPARNLKPRQIPAWLIYPAVYALLIVVRGGSAAWYPYPFMDADKLGYTKVLTNSLMLVALFLLFSFAFVFIGRKKTERR